MKVGFLTRYDEGRGSSRLRAFDLVPHLARHGVEARVLSRRRGGDGNGRGTYPLRALGLAAWADIMVLQKPNQAPALLDLLRTANRRLVVDLDDALWCPTSPAPTADERAAARRAEARLGHALRRARAAFAGSAHLARWMSERRPGLDVTVLPTSVDLDRYPVAAAGGRRLTLGWIGSGDNLAELEQLDGVLRELSSEVDFELRVISDRRPALPGLPVELTPWSPAAEVAALAGCDVGLMPLEDTERSRGRCGFKAIQYMATGLPVVASAVGAASEVVADGVTGFLAASPAEWLDRLRLLAADPARRRGMGGEGRRRAERLFSIPSNLPKLIAGLERVLQGRSGEAA